MNLFNFYKIFRHGQKAGKRSKNPTASISAHSEHDAWEKFREHSKFREQITYVCVDEGIAGAEEMPSAGQKKPGEWSIGDTCWTRLNPWDDNDKTYHEGVILKISDGPVPLAEAEQKISTELKEGPVYSIWLTGDFASWRARRNEQILIQPPKGRRRRRRKRPGRKNRVMPVKRIRRKKG